MEDDIANFWRMENNQRESMDRPDQNKSGDNGCHKREISVDTEI